MPPGGQRWNSQPPGSILLGQSGEMVGRALGHLRTVVILTCKAGAIRDNCHCGMVYPTPAAIYPREPLCRLVDENWWVISGATHRTCSESQATRAIPACTTWLYHLSGMRPVYLADLGVEDPGPSRSDHWREAASVGGLQGGPSGRPQGLSPPGLRSSPWKPCTKYRNPGTTQDTGQHRGTRCFI